MIPRGSHNDYCIGVCPELKEFLIRNRGVYENPLRLEEDLKSLEQKGVIRVIDCKKNQYALTLILKKDGRTIKEVEIEGVDHLHCLFFVSQMEGMTENGCRQPCCELACCVVKKLTAKLS
ncbi:MAG: hypothetical protein UT90_C0002G0041 [Parcubacteria group bacterium GW2011_GWA1_40_21]|nr:MAG: hypothetical protein UT80_C0030G0010 [Parcubacteria group bacterium GW2011_GWC1_40_13]KKR54084.1 MAG: hypothetical protein UT90_C0002G0041 [Parcubacteria group bacterium GW2011_GWA1_40_21]